MRVHVPVWATKQKIATRAAAVTSSFELIVRAQVTCEQWDRANEQTPKFPANQNATVLAEHAFAREHRCEEGRCHTGQLPDVFAAWELCIPVTIEEQRTMSHADPYLDHYRC